MLSSLKKIWKKKNRFDGEEVELESVSEFEDPNHEIFAPRKMVGSSEHSDFGISLLQAEESVFSSVDMEIQGSDETGEEDSTTAGSIEEAEEAGQQTIDERFFFPTSTALPPPPYPTRDPTRGLQMLFFFFFSSI